MYILKKINIRNYLFFTLANVIVIFMFITPLDAASIFLILLASIILNQLMLIYSVAIILKLVEVSAGNLKAIAMFILKAVVVGAGFYIVASKLPHYVLYAIVIYIFQLLILVISIKR
ncbi:hypothetical protein N9N67_03315 [Bacteriovoracaceae bacterium]|nr:hypothetical protein [Bacteriovoracaceae bacterium]